VKPKTFMLIAGEASGDLLAAELVAASTTSNVPPLQGGNTFIRTFSWGFTPSYHIAGLQPETETLKHMTRQTPTPYQQFAEHVEKGLKARHVIARAKGPGSPFTKNPQAL
jgi:lipid A disaccharide synthetase